MITIRRTPIWFSTQNEQREYREHGTGLRLRDCITDTERVGIWVAVNREPTQDWDRVLCDGDEILETTRPQGVAAIKILTFLGKVLLAAAVSFILGKIIAGLIKPKKRNENEGSGAYAWSGLRNDRFEGQPKQVIYGKIRAAPQVLDEYITTSTNTGENDLYTLLGFGEGRLSSIGDKTADTDNSAPHSSDDTANPLPTGIQIEGNAAENFGGILAWVRMGTSEQEPVPGFQQINTEYASGVTLSQVEQSSTDNSAINSTLQANAYNSGLNAAVWAQYGAAVDMTGEADAWACLIEFPSGLYRIKDNGSLDLAYFKGQVRYIELDSGGTPITTGGDNNDGYVYWPLDVNNDVAVAQTQTYNYQMTGQFLDPQSYTAPTLGRCLSVISTVDTGTVAYARTVANAVLPGSVSTSSPVSEFSVSFWVQADTSQFLNTFGQLSSDISTTNPSRIRHVGTTGWTFEFRNMSLSGGYRVAFKSTSPNWTSGPAYLYGAISSWAHLTVTYRRVDPVDGKSRLRYYLNGVQGATGSGNVGSLDIVIPNAQIEFGNQSDQKGFKVDEFLYVARCLSAAEIASNYNGGIGRYLTGAVDQVALYHFDFGAGLTDSSGRGNTLQLDAAGTTAGTVFGKVNTTGGSTVKRGKYRVEVLRRNIKSTSNFVSDESVFSQLISKDSALLAYPYTPILGMKIKATEQLNTSAPTITALVKGVPVPVYDGVSVTYQWSQNPAWIALDVISNPRYGRGIDFPLSRCNLEDFKAWADYCDELVPAGRSFDDQAMDETPGDPEPIANLRYDSTANNGSPGLEVHFRYNGTTGDATEPPAYWTPGRWIAFSGIPQSGTGLSVDISDANISGFEIVSKTDTVAGWKVLLNYTYGTAPWADTQFWDTAVTPALTGTAYLVEPRFTYNGVFDTFTNAWDALVSVCQTARAMPMIEGGIVRVRYERPRDPVAMVTMGNIVEGSFKVSFGDTVNQPNSYSCDFLDEDKNYQRSVASFDDPQLDVTTESYDLQRESLDLPGVTRRSQVMRQLHYLTNVNRLMSLTFEWDMGIDGLALEVGDVVQLSHDIMPFGTSGRILQDSTSATSVYLDRDVTLGAGSYELKILASAIGQTGSGSTLKDAFEVKVVSTGAGTVTLGNPIATTAGYSSLPKKGDLWMLYQTSEQLLVQIVEISLSEDFKRTVRAIKYDATVYDVEDSLETLPLSSQEPEDEPVANQRTIPKDVTLLEATDTIEQTPSGAFVQVIHLSWSHDADTIRSVAGARIMVRRGDEEPWQPAGSVEGGKTAFDYIVPDGTPARLYQFCVQPLSFGGQYRRPEQCTKVAIALRGIWAAPPPPLAFSATMQGDLAVYSITPPENSRGLAYEIRRGGWILGQPVGVIPEGQTSLATTNWVGAGSNALGESAPRLYVRSRDGRGQYSEAVVLEGFNPSPDGAVVLQPPYSDYTNYPDQAWEDFASSPGQWVNGGLGQPQLSGLQVTAYNGRNVIEFSGSNLSGTYTTAGKLTMLTAQPEWAWVQFHVVADQVSPWTVADLAELPVDSPMSSNMTAEGLIAYPRAATPEFDFLTDYQPCTIAVEMRFTTSAAGSFGDWVKYEPGYYNFVNVQFRVTFTRPSTAYSFRMYRCASRLSRQAVGVWERSPVQDLVLRKMVTRG